MTNEEAVKKLNALLNMCNPSPLSKELEDALNMAIKALEAQPCIEDYPTCTECEHYDSEKHYCPRFCQVIKDTLAEAQPTEMRDATEEERKSVKDYVESISKPTGVRFDAQLTDLTAEEKEIIDAIYKMGLFRTNYANDKVSKAVSKIIKAYDAQPSEDCINCISRESIKQKLQEHCNFYVNAYGGFSNLPQNDKSRVDEIDNCIAMVVNEPSVTPQRPKGKWINDNCSICGYGVRPWNNTPYCPNCGAEINGGGEDETNN